MDFSGGGGGATLSEMHQNARRLLMSAREGVAHVERLASAPTSSSYSSAPLVGGGGGVVDSAAAEKVRREVAQIQGLCAQMDGLWRSIPAKSQRDIWKRKVEQLSEEVDSLKETLDKYSFRQKKRVREAKERAELFERANGESSHVLQIFDDESQALKSAHSSSRMLDEAYETGVAILHKYADQRDRLKSAQRKALDVLNTVGLSNSVFKLIERRHRVDKWIAYAGMIITVVVMFVFWRWTH
uniref:Membrin n=1 Tax=Leersia perrieri TaxID=77586 RepID=A0A0D9VX14_9ORYZ